MITYENGQFLVDAETLAAGLRIAPDAVMQGLRDGTVTSLSEKGVEEDVGLFRLTFIGAGRRLRLTIDANGAIVKRSTSDYRSSAVGL